MVRYVNHVSMSEESLAMRIQLPKQFNVEWMLNHIRTSSYGLPYRFVDHYVLRRPLRLAGAPAIAEFDLSRAGSMGIHLISYRGHAAQSSRRKAALLRELKAQVRFLWGLDDGEGYHASIASDSVMAPLLERFGLLQIVRAPDMYEALLVAVIGQQVSVQAAQSIRRRLMHTVGTKVTMDNVSGKETYFLYPTPQQLIKAGASALRKQGLSRQKALYLLEIANCTVAGELDHEIFTTMADEDAVRRLCEIKGVGRWTAEVALMRGLDRLDIFPAGDLGLQAAVQKLWGMTERPSEKVLRNLAERWAGWRSYAAFYLWMTLQSKI